MQEMVQRRIPILDGYTYDKRGNLVKEEEMASTHDRREESGKEVPLKYSFSSL